MTILKSALVLASVTSLALLGACASNTKECCPAGGAAAKTTEGKVAVINTMCPIGGDDFGAKERPADLARTVDGQNIGFCCEGCVDKFDKMTAEKKKAVLTAATANKTL